jgi:hypothetical protein
MNALLFPTTQLRPISAHLLRRGTVGGCNFGQEHAGSETPAFYGQPGQSWRKVNSKATSAQGERNSEAWQR